MLMPTTAGLDPTLSFWFLPAQPRVDAPSFSTAKKECSCTVQAQLAPGLTTPCYPASLAGPKANSAGVYHNTVAMQCISN
jgi:hypothetical protein